MSKPGLITEELPQRTRQPVSAPRVLTEEKPACDLSTKCPQCSTQMTPEHAHYRCPKCGYRDSCCF